MRILPAISLSVITMTLVACATTTGVMPMGKDTYMVTGSSEFGIGSAQKAAIAKANSYAESQGKKMIPLTTSSGVERDFLGDSIKTFELQFRLVSEDDPAWHGSVEGLQPIPDQVVTVNDARTPAPVAAPAPQQGTDLYTELQKLKSLLDEGTITQDEFDTLKARLLAADGQ